MCRMLDVYGIFLYFLYFVTLCVHGSNLQKQAIKRAECSLGLIRDSDCPVDGGWSLWSAWSSCEGECGQTGHRSRHRTCSVPVPQNGGSKCQGSSSDTEACDLGGCSQDQYRRLVQGDELREAQFKVVVEFPLLMERCLVKDCGFDDVQRLLKDSSMRYWSALHCVKHNVGCPAKGGWSPWSPWSPCTAVCGLGSKFRQRNCTNPAPSQADLACGGPRLEQEACSGVGCSPYLRGDWSGWEQWSDCSVKCGSGVRTRVRKCLSKTNSQASGASESRKASHVECKGPDLQMEECHVRGCSVDGGWSAWEDWQPCSRTCGAGVRSRSRSCSNPMPQGKGQKCSGDVTEVLHCFARPCAVKSHHVAALNGDGSLLYSPVGTSSRLLHMYLRFLPTGLLGTLVHRHPDGCMGASCDYVSLSLEAGYAVLGAQVSGCSATIIGQRKLSLGEWHEVQLTVTATAATMRTDDDPQRARGNFNCVPLLPELDHSMRVGELFHGLIERITVNYEALSLKQDELANSPLVPYGSANVVYEVGDEEEGIRRLREGDAVELPCPSQPWLIEFSVKVQKPSGLLLYIPGEDEGDFVAITAEDDHVKLRCRIGSNYTTSQKPASVQRDAWIDVNLSVEEYFLEISVNGDRRETTSCLSPTCFGEMVLGDVPQRIKGSLKGATGEFNVEPLEAVLGSVTVGATSVDLGTLPLEEDEGAAISSRSASLAEVYDQVSTLPNRQVNMSCLYRGNVDSRATWLRLDVPLGQDGIEHGVADDGNLSELTISSHASREDVESFYACWIHPRGGVARVLVAYGVTVVEPDREFRSEPAAALEAIGASAAVTCFVSVAMLAFLYRHAVKKTVEPKT